MRGILKAAAVILSALSHSSLAHSVKRNALNYISRLDNPVIHTASNRVHAYASFDLTFLLHDEKDKIRISLEPNLDVLSDSAVVRYLSPDGSVTEEKIQRTDHKVFKGHAFVQHPHHSEWINSGWARITVYRDGPRPLFEGTFRVNGNHHHIQTSSNYRQTQHEDDPSADVADDEYMVVWRDSDIKSSYDISELKRDLGENSCSSDMLNFNNEDEHPVHRGLDLRDLSAVDANSLFGRDEIDGTTTGNGAGVNLTQSIGSTQGCPTTRKIALVGIAADCTYTAQFPNKSDVRSHIVQQVSSASALFESSFNISLGIQNLTISDAVCPGTPPDSAKWNVACGDSVTITNRLNLFSEWRGRFNDTNAYWTLMSTCNTDAAVGLAWLGQLCSQGSGTQADSSGGNETIAGANVVVRTSTEWQVFAHETGHTFGAFHDCVPDTCSDGTVSMQKCCPLSSSTCNANGAFIMNPSTSDGVTQFSPCTIGNICSAMGRNSVRSSCLTNNKNVVTISPSQCGNGIVETGEDCDCGGEEGCANNSCCDPGTCRFKTNAVCDPTNEDCCTAQCQFKSSGSVCRDSTGTCDPQETCSGNSGTCPADVKSADGQACGASGGGLTCASGQCTSRDLQCRTLVGSLTNNNATSACDSQTCQLRCASSDLGPNACYDMKQHFLDGTPCQGGGKCGNGQCKGSSFTDQVGSFFNDNKHIIIPVASAVGGFIVLCLLCCIFSSCRRRSRRRKIAKTTQPNSSWVGGAGGAWVANPVSRPPPAAPGRNNRGPPQQQQQSWQGENQWMPPRAPTMRYA
ncbi:Disintegrin and metalloproteinase domain-containing protein B [Daldinia childiae]|uniref:Disintegrin and metalloproteinase domain-containing protein B n=1 Tax=Daldinia childiae TaxID=326645 RepID=UPI0014452485|nr:Disintegrin and metalloproteinase domain-containing protein B [Daldinia childiae]KAF3071210.1 Disintegrin and metalloproteinase domain-containing protein B [Daldinia childiae]